MSGSYGKLLWNIVLLTLVLFVDEARRTTYDPYWVFPVQKPQVVIAAKERHVTPADNKPGRESSLDSGSRFAWPE